MKKYKSSKEVMSRNLSLACTITALKQTIKGDLHKKCAPVFESDGGVGTINLMRRQNFDLFVGTDRMSKEIRMEAAIKFV